MTGTCDNAVGNQVRYYSAFGRSGFRGWARQRVIRAIKSDCWSLDFRSFRELALYFQETRLARRVADAVAIGVDYDAHGIRVVERNGGPVKCFVGELPRWRPRLP